VKSIRFQIWNARHVENISTTSQETHVAVGESAKATSLLRDLARSLVGPVRVFRLA
jgi:methyl-accepting chemotaxis protein